MRTTGCVHERCSSCHHIVVPVARVSRLFITKYCPDCGSVISDVAKQVFKLKHEG